ncbi:retrovirus-related pol polyprotein from transposon TNT 1-94 [Tanacetum coccineum]
MFDDLQYVQSLEKELDELQSDKTEFSNEYDLLLQECLSKDILCVALSSMTDIDEYSKMACKYLEKVKECECLEIELSKQKDTVCKEDYHKLVKSFCMLEQHSISLELALQQYKDIAISELKKLIEKSKGKSVETKFDKPFVVRQTNAIKVPKPSVLDKPTPFSDSLEKTLNVNVVCATCGKCVFNSIHDACASKFLNEIVQIIIFIVDSGCTKHMTGNLKLLCNFVEKYLGTVRFGNDQFAPILGYGDLVQGNITIKRVYYVKGLNHNLFSVGQFCDTNMEVAFGKSTCYIRDLQGNNLLTAKASPTQAWLWHRKFCHLNFDTINLLSKNDIVKGLLKLKFVKDQLCSSCEMGKAKRSSFKSLTVKRSKKQLDLLHMDLCGPMRIETINEKKYILVIFDDYSRYTWTLFLRSKDETPKVLKDFLKMIQRKLQAQVITIRVSRVFSKVMAIIIPEPCIRKT